LVLFVAFTVRGLIRGMISEIFAVIGLVAGFWAAGWVSQWVLGHWRGAQPAAAFFFLRWLVVITAALTVAALCQWWGQRMKGAVGATPAGLLDRAGGLVLGAAIGGIIAAFTVLALLSLSGPARGLAESAGRARLARPLMATGANACAAGSRFFPGSGWLQLRFLAAERRANRHAQSS
jgi:uncharacterized membrane protein required for colicin V production